MYFVSRHSKWSKIKHQKGAADVKRALVFTKLARAITVAARTGGADPAMNFALRLAIDKARAGNMPKDNVERAMKRGSGEDANAGIMEEALYEAIGPGGVGIMIEAVTDNKNRTVGEIKHLLSQYGGTLSGPGSVSWQFIRRAVIHIPADISISHRETFELDLIDAGAEDIRTDADGMHIEGTPGTLSSLVEKIQSLEIVIDESGLEWVAKETLPLHASAVEQFQDLYAALEELDDVQHVYTNAS